MLVVIAVFVFRCERIYFIPVTKVALISLFTGILNKIVPTMSSLDELFKARRRDGKL